MDKEYWAERYRHRIRSFPEIARALGKEHSITQMMGTLSYGRHDWEITHPVTKEALVGAASALDGCFHILNLWARDHDVGAQDKMLAIWHGDRRA